MAKLFQIRILRNVFVTVVIAGSSLVVPLLFSSKVFALTPKVSVSCVTTPVVVHSSTNCTASITKGDGTNTLNGIQITFSRDGSGSFSPATTCYLSGDANLASCSVSYTPSVVGTGTHKITATFEGNSYYPLKSGQTNLKVSQIALTVTGITANNKTYDGTTTATLSGTATLNGVISPDIVSLAGTAVGFFNTANVGTGKTVSVSGLSLTGANASNYTLSPLTLSANVAPLNITGSFTANNKTYDGTTDATVTTRPLTGVLSGDLANVSLSGGSASFSDATVGTGKTVTASGMSLSGTAAGNYNLTSVATTTANITKADDVLEAATAATTQVNRQTYTVVSGDTLFGIGTTFGVDWHLIASLNGINTPYTIYPGQVLRLPSGSVATLASEAAAQGTGAGTDAGVLGESSNAQIATPLGATAEKLPKATTAAPAVAQKATSLKWYWYAAIAAAVLAAGAIYYVYQAADKTNKKS